MILTSIVSWGLIIAVTQLQESCSSLNRDMEYDNTCVPTDCSQPASSQNLQAFPCRIGHQKACDSANFSSIGVPESIYSFAFLASIGTYMYSSPGLRDNPSLIFSFLTPHGGVESLKTKAVQVDFSSPRKYGGDDFYSKHPRCRLFDFGNATRTDFDMRNPREIEYKCLVGLSIANEITYYYTLMLTSLPSRAVTKYMLVVHTQNERREMYKLVIGVAAIPLRRSIHVVFQRPSEWFKVKACEVTLNLTDTITFSIKKSLPYGDFWTEFTQLQPGDYVVMVACRTTNGSTPFPATRSRPIRLLYLTDLDSSSGSLLKTTMAATAGAVLGFILIVILVMYYSKKPTPEGVCLVCHQQDAHRVLKLSPLLKDTLQVNVTFVHQGNAGNRKPADVMKYTDIVIVCSDNSTTSNGQNNQSYFRKMLDYLEKSASSYRLHFVCIHKQVGQDPHQHLDLFTRKITQSCFKGLPAMSVLYKKRNNPIHTLPGDCIEFGKELKPDDKHIDWDTFSSLVNEKFNPNETRGPSHSEIGAAGSIDAYGDVDTPLPAERLRHISDRNANSMLAKTKKDSVSCTKIDDSRSCKTYITINESCNTLETKDLDVDGPNNARPEYGPTSAQHLNQPAPLQRHLSVSGDQDDCVHSDWTDGYPDLQHGGHSQYQSHIASHGHQYQSHIASHEHQCLVDGPYSGQPQSNRDPQWSRDSDMHSASAGLQSSHGNSRIGGHLPLHDQFCHNCTYLPPSPCSLVFVEHNQYSGDSGFCSGCGQPSASRPRSLLEHVPPVSHQLKLKDVTKNQRNTEGVLTDNGALTPLLPVMPETQECYPDHRSDADTMTRFSFYPPDSDQGSVDETECLLHGDKTFDYPKPADNQNFNDMLIAPLPHDAQRVHTKHTHHKYLRPYLEPRREHDYRTRLDSRLDEDKDTMSTFPFLPPGSDTESASGFTICEIGNDKHAIVPKSNGGGYQAVEQQADLGDRSRPNSAPEISEQDAWNNVHDVVKHLQTDVREQHRVSDGTHNQRSIKGEGHEKKHKRKEAWPDNSDCDVIRDLSPKDDTYSISPKVKQGPLVNALEMTQGSKVSQDVEFLPGQYNHGGARPKVRTHNNLKS